MSYSKDYRIKVTNEESFCINIKDFFAEYFRKLPAIIVCVLIFAIGMPVLSVVNEKSQYEANMQLLDSLTEEELAEVNEFIEFNAAVESERARMADSILLNLNSSAVDYARAYYYIASENGDVIDDVMVMYDNYISGYGMAMDISENSDKWNYGDLKYLVGVKLVKTEYGSYSNALQLTVYGSDSAMCEEILKEAEIQMTAFGKEQAAMVGDISVSLVSVDYLQGASTIIKTAQEETVTTFEAMTTDLAGEKAKLSGVQLQAIAQKSESQSIVGEPKVDTSDVLIGAVLGIVVSVVLIAVAYLFNGKIKYERELQERYGLRCFGGISTRKQSVFARLGEALVKINKLGDGSRKYVVSRLKVVAEQGEINKIVFVGDNEKEVALLVEEFEKDNAKIKACYVGDVLTFEDAISEITSENKIVLVEELKKSKIKDVYHKIILCKEHEAEILGYISLR